MITRSRYRPTDNRPLQWRKARNSLDRRKSLAQPIVGEDNRVMAPPTDDPRDRELSIGRVFERAVWTIRHRPGIVLTLTLLFAAVPSAGLEYAMVEAFKLVGDDAGVAGMAVMSAIFTVIWGLVTTMVQAVLVRAVIAASRGQGASLASSVLDAVQVAPALIGLSLVTSAATILGLALLIVPGMMLWVMWSVAVPVLVVERADIVTALRRSSWLTRGSRRTVFGLILILIAISLTVSIGVEFGTGEWDNSDPAAALGNPIHLGLRIFGNAVQASLFALVTASLYVDLRHSKEGPTSENLEQVFA
ncbi:MAG: hypothetical protein ACJ8EQ_03860 [Sphingomicrobium sp.]